MENREEARLFIEGLRNDNKTRRRKGLGGKRYREDKQTFEYSIDLGKDENGKRIRKVRSAATDEEAYHKILEAIDSFYDEQEAQLKNQILEKQKSISPKGAMTKSLDIATTKVCGQIRNHNNCDMTFIELYIEFVNKRKRGFVKSGTLACYATSLNRFKESFDGIKLSDFSLDSYYSYAIDALQGENPITMATLKQKTNYIKQALDYAVEKGYIYDNFFYRKKIKLPFDVKKSEKVCAINYEDCKALLEVSKFENITVYTMLFTLLYSGIRIGEMSALKISDINLENSSIHIDSTITRNRTVNADLSTNYKGVVDSSPKTEKSERVVLVKKEVIHQLFRLHESYRYNKLLMEKIRMKGTEDYIFVNKKGNVRPPNDASRLIREFGELHGYVGIKPHRLRHTFTTTMARAKIPPLVEAKVLGHSSEKMLKTYTDIDTEDCFDACQLTTEFLDNKLNSLAK